MPRYAYIQFPYLLTEYVARTRPETGKEPFVLTSRQRGRVVIESVNASAAAKGIWPGMVLADCKALFPGLLSQDSEPGKAGKILDALAQWSIRYTPYVAVDMPDGLLLDASGCTHLWGGEATYLKSIETKIGEYGYTLKTAMADTIGAAWATARYGTPGQLVSPGCQLEAIRLFPPEALRLDASITSRLRKLGFRNIGSFADMPASVLRRRFGAELPLRIGQALGHEIERLSPVIPVEPYQERLHAMDPIATAKGIAIGLEKLLDALCRKLEDDGMGLRKAVFKAFRTDGDQQQIEIGTHLPSRNAKHLFRLFEHKIATLEPRLGFELFVLEAPKVEVLTGEQAAIWEAASRNDAKVMQLLDRITARTGAHTVSRYLPDEHYWPERSVKRAVPLWEKTDASWRTDLPRPVHLLPRPEIIEVSAVLPDYPPMLFRYKGKLHTLVKSDGPERIEQEWWIADGLYRDYYCAEDQEGARYWIFRSGPYDTGKPKWFIHGFFA